MKKRLLIYATMLLCTFYFPKAIAEENDIQIEETGVTGIEVKRDFEYGDIQDYYYDIVGDTVFLDSYNGKAPIIELKTSYVIDGVEYKTDISEFNVGIGDDYVKTVIFSEGFTSVYNSVFNSCSVENVYFPKSMTEVYDDTLAYLEPDTQERIKIYYGGTQDEWYEIFKKYQRTKVEDAEFGADLGTALADKLNEMLGHEYDSSNFEYFFSANPEDLKI